ncbi:hypothetical protein ES705_42588 [subsurface metagenome]
MAKGPFMEYIRGQLALSAANTFTEIVLQTPTSKTENMAMLIHSIEFEPSYQIDLTPAESSVNMQVTRSTQSAIIMLIDPDLIAKTRSRFHLNAVANWLTTSGERKQTFDPPLLYPRSQIYLGMSTVAFVSVISGACRIGYTLEKVSREDFISALVE